MALRATIHKADLHVADSDRHYYGSHSLTIAKHPSETEERMMIRIIAFALQANEDLTFTKGLSDTDEPDLWIKDLTDAIKLWIEIGQPDERRILKACGRADQVIVYCYGGQTSKIWWDGIASGKYIDKMSNYCKKCPLDPSKSTGEDACPFTTLYWNYLIEHKDELAKNPRMLMQIKNVNRLSDETARAIALQAKTLKGHAHA